MLGIVHRQIDLLHQQGIDICRGCTYEHAASCDESRINVCKERIDEISNRKITNKDGWCIILLTAIQLGYPTSFNKNALQEYLAGRSSVEYHLIPMLEREALALSCQICIDGRADEANKIAASI